MTTPNMPRDGASEAIQALRPGVSQRIALTGSSDTAASALSSSTRVVRISGDQDMHYTANGTADNTQPFLNAGAYEYISVNNGDTPEFFNPAGGVGFVTLTEME